MRSESLIRFSQDEPPRREYGTEEARRRIASDVQAFLARGGEIQQLPANAAAAPIYKFTYSSKAE